MADGELSRTGHQGHANCADSSCAQSNNKAGLMSTGLTRPLFNPAAQIPSVNLISFSGDISLTGAEMLSAIAPASMALMAGSHVAQTRLARPGAALLGARRNRLTSPIVSVAAPMDFPATQESQPVFEVCAILEHKSAALP